MIALSYLFFITLITGLLYPLAVTLASKLIFPARSNGSLIKDGDSVRGSMLVGQEFKSDKFFHGRPSCSSYDAMTSGASNLSVTSAVLKAAVDKRREEWSKAYGISRIPEEMLYASASGLDPEISPEAALIQVERISKARGYGEHQKTRLREYIKGKSVPKGISVLNIPRLNVVEMNLMLEGNGRHD
ncbi:MAG TPA: K(+)-transporting ATPase subunit C [Lentisphaeria bacterium]|nr:K(+)-transporting ATPase subunit C [Lentisphaeria bacterium]